MATRRPSPPPTRPPPPPDPIDAAEHFRAHAQQHTSRLRDWDDNETTATGQHPINISVTIPERQPSAHDIDPVAAKKANPGGLAAAIVLLASCLAAICKALGWL